MNYEAHDVRSAASNFSIIVFGDDAVSPTIHFRPLEYLKLLASARRLDYIYFKARLASFSCVEEPYIHEVCRQGFFHIPCSDSAVPHLACCFCCNSMKSLAEYPAFASSHEESCQFFILLSHKDTLVQDVNIKLLNFLKQQLLHARVQVAEELGFTRDFICVVLTQKYFHEDKNFATAGELVEAVNDLEELLSENEVVPLIQGIADYIRSVPLDSLHSCSDPNMSRQVYSKKEENYQLLRRETLALLLMTMCRGCNAGKNVEFVALPCGHFCLCGSCSRVVERCPICHDQIFDLVRTYGP